MTGDDAADIREDLPADVYAARADYVRLAVKETTARRMVNWLDTFAAFCDLGGNTKTAEHARAVSDRFAAELDVPVDRDQDTGGEGEA